MTTNMDKSLDEILGEQKPRRHNNHGRFNDRRPHNNHRNDSRGATRRRDDYPRDGVKKANYRDDQRDLDSEWVHDRYEDNSRRGNDHRRRRDSFDRPTFNEARGTRIRVDNIHYDLTEDELRSLFDRIGRVVRFQLRYDRAGRSEGVAFVTYESYADAKKAIADYNGANANGQPITLSLVSSEAPSGSASSGSRRNPFDSAVMPGRSLADRVSSPRDRSFSPRRHIENENATGLGIDRYVPGHNSRSRSPMHNRRHQGGRRPGDRRQFNNGRGHRSGGAAEGGRPRKTQEELDAEMANYFGDSAEKTGEQGEQGEQTAPVAAVGTTDDVDMIE